MSPAGRKRLAAFMFGAFCLAMPSCRNSSSSTASKESGGRDLAVALGTRRFVEPRVTGSFRYAPVEEISATPRPREQELLRAVDSIRQKVQALDPESLHTAGRLALALGRVDQSVDSLRRAAGGRRSAAILSDLAAAYLVRARDQDRPIDLAAALDAAERAVELGPRSPEALFNRALARQRLSLTGEAVKAWQEYLALETDPGWTREAKLALERFQAPTTAELWEAAKPRLREAARKGDQKTVTALVDRYRQEARELAEGELLGGWADHQRRGELVLAANQLAAARAIGHALARLSGESMLTETVAAIDEALQKDPQRLRLLIEGLRAYREGFLQLEARVFTQAAEPLERARRALGKAATPFAAWADFGLVRCAYQREDFIGAERRARELLGRLETARYPALVGRARWVLGTSQMARARPAEALASYQLALPFFERTRETANEATVHSRLASAYNELGDWRSAWQHRAKALPVLSRQQEPSYRVALINVALGALDAGFTYTALITQTESVNLARAQSDPEQLANSLIIRASILARAGLAEPEVDLGEARENCERIQDSTVRQSILADLLAVEGYAFRRQDPERALAALDQAVEMYRGSERLIMLAPSLHTRAIAFQQLGRDAEAERDLQAAIESLEEERGSVKDATHRAEFIGRTSAEEIFDSMILLQLQRGNAESALEYSERRRARLLLDWLSALPSDIDIESFRLDTWTRPRSLWELRQGIPPGIAVLVCEVLRDRLVLWVVRRGSLDLRQVPISEARVEELARRFGQAAKGPERKLQSASAALHELLIAPVADLLSAGETVVFMPDDPLGSVPVALLFDARRGRYLIEDRAIALSPSLSLFTTLARKTGPQDFSEADFLVIADPAFDRSLYPMLPRLPGAQEEVGAIQSLYRRAQVVSGDAADRETLLAGVGRYRVLHFGGHALANAEKPLYSSLLLAPGSAREESGTLYARDIVGRPDGGTDLVVLSSCRSAGGAAQPGEGVAGLVWSLFSRGVSMVVASTREVEDREAARLFTSFYRHLAAGAPPVHALRAAQLEALAHHRAAGRSSFDWAVFQIYGAVAGSETMKRKGEEP